MGKHYEHGEGSRGFENILFQGFGIQAAGLSENYQDLGCKGEDMKKKLACHRNKKAAVKKKNQSSKSYNVASGSSLTNTKKFELHGFEFALHETISPLQETGAQKQIKA